MTADPSRLIEPVAAAGLLVVAVDRLPAWILPTYGATWVAMPHVDALAAEGLVLDRMIVTGDDPLATLADLLGGPGAPPPLVAAAAARGWQTAIVTDDATAAVADADVFRVAATLRPLPEREADATCLARLAAAAAGIVTGGRHRLVVVHASSLGICWDAPADFREAYVDPEDPPPPAGADVPDFEVAADADPDLLVGIRQAFAGQLTLLDRCVADLLAAAAAARWTIVFAGLRGLALGLHDRVGLGGAAALGEIVHVPAIVADAAGRMAGQRHGGLVVPADLGATLVELVGGAAPATDAAAPWRGASLGGLFESWAVAPRDRVVAVTGGGAAVVTPAWHCMAGGGTIRLFAKPDDYFELCDVADRAPEVAEELGRLAAAAAGADRGAAWTSPLSGAALGGLS